MKKSINRRTVLSSILGYFLTKPLYAKLLCPITPSQPKGPFYKKNILNVLDMTNKGKALGEIIEIKGIVSNAQCRPEHSCTIKIWQANSFGKYNHKNDLSINQIDPNFVGYNKIKTKKNGSFKFTTILPGPYKVSKNIVRAPHIHLLIKTKGNKELITQLYFKNNLYNKNDFLFKRLKKKELLEVSLKPKKYSKIKTGTLNINL